MVNVRQEVDSAKTVFVTEEAEHVEVNTNMNALPFHLLSTRSCS